MSGGVAVLFSKKFTPYSFNAEEIIKGRVLKFTAVFEKNSFVFICVYAPTMAIEKKNNFFEHFGWCFKWL